MSGDPFEQPPARTVSTPPLAKHEYQQKPGLDWCVCGQPQGSSVHVKVHPSGMPSHPGLVQVDNVTWVHPKYVAGVIEEYFPGSDTWLVRLYLRYGGPAFTLHETRAAAVVAALNGEDLR